MLNITDKLPITEQDLQYFIGKWFQHSDDETIKQKERYHFIMKDDVISVSFATIHHHEDGTGSGTSTGFDYVKMQQSFKEHPTYHMYNQNIVFDGELFFMENCKHDQKQLEGAR